MTANSAFVVLLKENCTFSKQICFCYVTLVSCRRGGGRRFGGKGEGICATAGMESTKLLNI